MSRNALHVLRILWRDSRPLSRPLSTAVINSYPSTDLNAQRITDSSAPDLDDFLEPESSDYEMATMVLPPIQVDHKPIPWPTLFAPTESTTPLLASSSSKQSRRPCDLLAKLAAEGDLVSARAVYDELKALHSKIQHRFIYLQTALATLDTSLKGRKDFLLWFNLYPNRPATNSHPDLKKTWQPVINHLCTEFCNDFHFLAEVLKVAGKKGLLPVIFPQLLAHTTLLAPPAQSRKIFEDAIEAYRSTTMSMTSTSEKARFQSEVVDAQCDTWWNSYLRHLIRAGWKKEALAVYESREGWESFTLKLLFENRLLKEPPLDYSEPYPRQKSFHNLDSSNAGAGNADPISSRIQSILSSSRELPTSPNQLAHLIRDIELATVKIQDHPTNLLFQFREDFCNPPEFTHPGRNIPTSRERLWWHAEMIKLRRQGRDAEVVDLFQKRFLWVGLPDHPVRMELGNISESAQIGLESRPLVHPSIQIITTLLPSFLILLPPTSLLTYHSAYLSNLSNLPPSLQPHPSTHLCFLRAITHILGPSSGMMAIDKILQKGLEPGEACWNGLLLSLAGSGKVDAVFEILTEMESSGLKTVKRGWTVDGVRWGGKSRPVKNWRPSKRTYQGLIHVFRKMPGMEKEVWQVLERMEVFLGIGGLVEKREMGFDLGVKDGLVEEAQEAPLEIGDTQVEEKEELKRAVS